MSDSKQRDPNSGSPSPADLVEQGRALHRAGDLDAAERLYRRALAEDPDTAEAHQLLAVMAGQRGNLEEAIAGFRRTIALDGPTPTRLFNLAEAYRVAGNFDAALAAYSQALTLDAAFFDAYSNCAEAAKETAAQARAQGNGEAADRLTGIAAHYLLGLGHARLRAKEFVEAERAYREVVALAPDRAEAHNNLGNIAMERHQPVEAEQCFRSGLALEPTSPSFLTNLGTALLNQVRLPEAETLFRRAVDTDPSFEDAEIALRDQLLTWRHYRSDMSPKALFEAHREWGLAAVERGAADASTLPPLRNSREPDRKLSIAYVALDADPGVRHGFFEPLVAHHDRAAFDIAVYALSSNFDARARRLRQITGSWRPVALHRAKEVAEKMRGARIDIAIDLAGHLPHGRLDVFALRPAPVCVAWLGYPGTTGLPTVNYRITDGISDPPGAEELYAESLYRMPGDCSFVFRPPELAPEVAPVRARAAGAVTFGNFDDPRKISPETVAAWGAILESLPASRLLLIAREFADHGYVARLKAQFAAVGIGTARVEMREGADTEEDRFRAYAEADILLDTFPYNMSRAAACEALWMGVPIAAVSGDWPSARLTASVLAQVGLERLDSHTPKEFVETAIELAEDLGRLHQLRAGMRQRLRVSQLMDEAAFTRRFEAALRDMWHRWCRTGA